MEVDKAIGRTKPGRWLRGGYCVVKADPRNWRKDENGEWVEFELGRIYRVPNDRASRRKDAYEFHPIPVGHYEDPPEKFPFWTTDKNQAIHHLVNLWLGHFEVGEA
jgi:hypothetical protein